MSKMWEVDPETKTKLAEIQKTNGNSSCIDCGAPSPQWASPKFGIFMCLNCSGVHRGLGVHVSFVRSITMDAFKTNELAKMAAGGNKPWKDFFDSHTSNKLEARTFEDSTISERYDSEAGEEYKDRLTAKAEGKDYVPGEKPKKTAPARTKAQTPLMGSRSGTPVNALGKTISNNSGAALGSRSASPALGTNALGRSKKQQNEDFFAKMGAENASRPDDLPPNQGGKFAGFGSDWPPKEQSTRQQGLPGADEFQRDPVAALTKGFGWFSAGVSKVAKDAAQKLSEADLAKQAQTAATTIGSTAYTTFQQGSKGLNDQFSRFVEGGGDSQHHSSSSANKTGPDPDKRDFWDSFASAADEHAMAKKAVDPAKKDFWDDFSAIGDRKAEEGKKDFWDEFSGGAMAKKEKPSVGTAAMSKRKPAGAGAEDGKKKDDDWGAW